MATRNRETHIMKMTATDEMPPVSITLELVEHEDVDHECWYVKRVSDGQYLSAHDDHKHVYWSECDEPWTWEQFTLVSQSQSQKEASYFLKTAHDTFLTVYEHEDEDSTTEDDYISSMWQVDCGMEDDTFEDLLQGDTFIVRVKPTHTHTHTEIENENEEEDDEDNGDEDQEEDQEEEEEEEEAPPTPPVKKVKSVAPPPPSAYIIKKAKKALADKLQQKNPELECSGKDFTKLVTHKWNSMSEETKAKWIDMVKCKK